MRMTNFLDTTPKAWSMKEKIDKLHLIKIKNSRSVEGLSIKWEDKPQTGRKYLQNTHLIKDYYTKYTKNPNFNNKKMNMIKRWAKNLYRQLTKDVYMHKKRCSHHTSLWNFKLKQWDSTTYLLEWQESKTLTTLNAGKDEELFIHELSFINGGNAKCYSHVGRQLWQLLRKLNIFLSYR